jgi:hypothetical protein
MEPVSEGGPAPALRVLHGDTAGGIECANRHRGVQDNCGSRGPVLTPFRFFALDLSHRLSSSPDSGVTAFEWKVSPRSGLEPGQSFRDSGSTYQVGWRAGGKRRFYETTTNFAAFIRCAAIRRDRPRNFLTAQCPWVRNGPTGFDRSQTGRLLDRSKPRSVSWMALTSGFPQQRSLGDKPPPDAAGHSRDHDGVAATFTQSPPTLQGQDCSRPAPPPAVPRSIR